MSNISAGIPKLNAISGWYWLKTGFKIFKSQPLMISFTVLLYLLLLILANGIPYVGFVLGCLLWPVLTFGLLSICAEVAFERSLKIGMLLNGFTSNFKQEFFKAGIAYLLLSLALIAVALFSVILIFKGAGISLPEFGGSNEESLTLVMQQIGLTNTLLMLFLFILASMILSTMFWFAPALIGWKGMKMSKALFYSVYGIVRNISAFVVFGLLWLFILIGVVFIAGLLTAMIGSPVIMTIISIAIGYIGSIILITSLYASYVNIFGVPAIFNSKDPITDKGDPT